MNDTNNYFAFKQHFVKKDGKLICNCNTFLKKSLKHSSELEENMKIKFEVGGEVNIVNDFNDDYYLIRLQKCINRDLGLIMYRDPRGCGNFGDELSEIILKFLFKKYSISGVEISLNKSKENTIVFIGSMIGWANNHYNNIHVLGSGIRTERDEINKNTKMKIHSVRGPLTKQYLEKYNYHVSSNYGDPALLLPNFYNPNKISLCKNKIGVVGHLTNFHKYNSIPDHYIMINPTWNWEKVVDYICSCDIILSSSLHGLIIADAYNIPNIWLDEFPLHEGHFKFKDYFLSQNRKCESIKNINEYKDMEPYKKGNTIDLSQIESAFINMCTDMNYM